MSDKVVEQWQLADEEVRKNLPPGVKLLRTLRGHTGLIGRIAWSPDGHMLASPSEDKTIRLWNAETGECLHTLLENGEVLSVAFDHSGRILASACDDNTVKLWEPASGKLLCTMEGHQDDVLGVAFDTSDNILASGSKDKTIKLWEPTNGKLLCTLEGHQSWVFTLAFDPSGRTLASGSEDKTIKLWEPASGKLLRTLEGHQERILSVAFDPTGNILASGCRDKTIKLWEAASGKLLRTLEGHTTPVRCVCFSADGRILASQGARDNCSMRLWRTDTGAVVASIPGLMSSMWPPGLTFNPRMPLLATVGSDPGAPKDEDMSYGSVRDCVIQIWELDFAVLLGQQPAKPSITYTSAKIVLVGDSGVGKTGLGWRLAHGEFKEHSSTHGQQFWLLSQLCKQRLDGTQCEAVLWDLAGQPDYRLIHALFLDDADLALVLFDPTHND